MLFESPQFRDSASAESAPPLSLTLIAGRERQKDGPTAALRRRAYAFWHTNWLQTFREHNGEAFHLSSDSFALADILVYLHRGDEPVALGLVNLIDLACLEHRSLSFLECIAAESLDGLLASGAEQAVLARFFTIAPEYRRNESLSYKQVLFNVLGELWRSTGAPVLIATARQDRGMTKAMIAMGGEMLQSNLNTRGIAVDFVAMQIDKLKLFSGDAVLNTSERLWRDRKDYLNLRKAP